MVLVSRFPIRSISSSSPAKPSHWKCNEAERRWQRWEVNHEQEENDKDQDGFISMEEYFGLVMF